MPKFSLPPLPTATELPPLPTLNALGDAELDFAIRELAASDEKPPLKALEVIQRHPVSASQKILARLEEQLPDYLDNEYGVPRSTANLLIVLACLGQPETYSSLLESIAASDDFAEVLIDSVGDLLPRTLAATIPDIATWRALADEYGFIPDTALVDALPFLVYWKSLDRRDAAEQLIEYFRSSDELLLPYFARATVEALLCLAVPETRDAVHEINLLAPSEEQKTVDDIEAFFIDPESSVAAASGLLNRQRLNDPVQCFNAGNTSPPFDEVPESLSEGLRLIDETWDTPETLRQGMRCMLRQPDDARRVLFDYVQRNLRTVRIEETEEEFELRQQKCGPAHAVQLLVELRCPDILPLLLDAFEGADVDCLPGFEQFVGPMLESLAAFTAPSPEFLVARIRRLKHSAPISLNLIMALGWMVLEERADRLHTIGLLRELYVDLVDQPDPLMSELQTGTVSLALMMLGDAPFFASLSTQQKPVPDFAVRHFLRRDSSADRIAEEMDERAPDTARSWFISNRFMTADDQLTQHFVQQCLEAAAAAYQEDDEEDDSEYEDEGYYADDAFFEDDDPGLLLPPVALQGGLPSEKLDMESLHNELYGQDPDDAPVTIRNSVKIGRNDPCPCGSGRKYKKCCGS